MAAAVGIGIEGEKNGARAVAQLSKLVGVEGSAQRAGDVAKTRLPQHGIVEQPLDENELGAWPNLLPGMQATPGAREKSMSAGGIDTTAVEVDDASCLATREDDAPVKGVAALRVEQAETPQEIQRIALSCEMTAQARAGGVADPQVLDRGGIVQSALLKILAPRGSDRVAVDRRWRLAPARQQGRLEERFAAGGKRGFGGRTDGGTTGQSEGGRRLAAAVTVKEIFAGVDVERRPGFRVQRTESDELGAVTYRPGGPMLLPQIIQQRQALFEFFDILVHGAVLPPETSVGEGRQPFQGRGGWKHFLRDAGARGFADRS